MGRTPRRILVLTSLTSALVGILLLASACSKPEVSPPPHSSPFLPPGTQGYEASPVQHWRVTGTQAQADQLSELWGQSIMFVTLLDRVFPETAKELPTALAAFAPAVHWPTLSVNWDRSLSDGYVGSVSGMTIVSGTPETNQRPTIHGIYGFHYYIGKKSLETRPQLVSPDSGGIPYYYLSIYIPE